MSALADLTEEERPLCNRCQLRPRAAGKRMTWCQPCKNEWQRAYRAGVRLQTRIDPPVRTPDGCLIFQGRINPESGYGQLTGPGQTTVYAHRVAWEQAYGPIPEGLTVDHLCEVKLCIEPTHLDLCTRGENTQRYFERRRACQLSLI